MLRRINLKSMEGLFVFLLFPLLLILLIGIPELLHPGFYYYDDARHFFLPAITEIGHSLWAGEAPWLSLRSWFSGDFVGEGQFALFNPVNLLLYMGCAKLMQPQLAAFLFAGSYLFLTGIGMYVLARSYRVVPAYAALAAIAYCSSSFQMYFYATSWWNALAGMCWLIWAWAFWLRMLEGRRVILGAFISTTFMLSAGWPHAALGFFIISIGLLLSHRTQIDRTVAAKIVAVTACSIAASLPAIYPLLEAVMQSARSGAGIRSGSLLAGSLEFVFAASWPSYIPTAPVFFAPARPEMPPFYLGWFVVPSLLLALRRWGKPLWCRDMLMLVLLTGVLILLTLGPERFYVIRWPLRFLPIAHICMVVTACMVLGRLGDLDRTDMFVWVGYASTGFVASCLLEPGVTRIHFTLFLIAVLVLFAFFRFGNAEHKRVRILLFSSIVFPLVVYAYWPYNRNVDDWPVPDVTAQSSHPASLEEGGNSRLILMSQAVPCEGGSCPYASGAIGLWEPGRQVNGYTPVPARWYASRLGFNVWSWSAPWAVANYFQQDAVSGLRLFELMRIDEIRVPIGVLAKKFLQEKHGGWMESKTEWGSIYRYEGAAQMAALPGTLSWHDEQLLLQHLGAKTDEERLRLLPAPVNGRIIFARAWYPGYEATLDGLPLVVERHADLLVSVLVPAGSSGDLVLRFRPPGFAWAVPLALLACATIVSLVISEQLLVRKRAR